MEIKDRATRDGQRAYCDLVLENRMNATFCGFVLHNCNWGERICSRTSEQPKGMIVLRRSNDMHEVSMFSLIALYFEYRKDKAAHIAATHAAVGLGLPANDVSSVGIARAA